MIKLDLQMVHFTRDQYVVIFFVIFQADNLVILPADIQVFFPADFLCVFPMCFQFRIKPMYAIV